MTEESKALAVQQPTALLAPEICALVPDTLAATMQLAQWLSSAKFLPAHLNGKPEDTFAIMLAGRELGLPPMAALRGLYIVNGKPSLESRTKAALCLSRGAAVYFKRISYTPTETTWETKRRDTGEVARMSFTFDEAKSAGLADKAGPWKFYPRRMISMRALGWLCDDIYPDVVLGIGTAEDRFDTEDAIDADFVDVPRGMERLPSTPVAESSRAGVGDAGTDRVDEARQAALDAIAKLDADKASAIEKARADEAAKPTAPLTEDEITALGEQMAEHAKADDIKAAMVDLARTARTIETLKPRLAPAGVAWLGERWSAANRELKRRAAEAKP